MTTVVCDARLAIRGLGIATFVDRLFDGFAAHPAVEVTRWAGTGDWGRRGQLSTLARSGAFDLSPRLDPRCRRFDVVHFACNTAALVPGPSSVLTVHDLMYRRRLRARDRVVGALLERGIRRAGRVVAVSGQTAKDIESAFSPTIGTVQVIPHGMRRLAARTTERVHVLAFGGGADPRKRVDLMIATYEAYRDAARDPLALVVLARAGLSEQQRARLAALGARLVPTATGQEVDDLMASAAALIYPTTEEGFGLPLLEAAEAGTPVVMDASARVAAEVVGSHCVRVPEPHAARWADALTEAIAGGPRHGALCLPDWATVAGQYVEIYEDVAR